jgi:hypothetical protein
VIWDKHASCGAAEDTPIGDGVAVVPNALDISEENVAFQAEKARCETPRMVCWFISPNGQIMTILRPGDTTLHGH